MRILFALFIVAALAACSGGQKMSEVSPTDGYALFGDTINPAGAMNAADFLAAMGDKETMDAKIEAPITAACQKKGCWMTMDLGTEEDMRVRFVDYGFFVPLDCAGETAVIEGVATVVTTSVADLQHYAEDEGLPQEEIDAITEDKKELTFLASGVAIKQSEEAK